MVTNSLVELSFIPDFSLRRTNGRTYFFKDSQYWRFSNQTLDPGYPKEISRGFEGIPNNIDAAFVWSGNGKIYFFKQSYYWRFDPDQNPPVKSSYPRPSRNWDGLPQTLDAALYYKNGFTYFFKDNQYWRFNDRRFSVSLLLICCAWPCCPQPTITIDWYWWPAVPQSHLLLVVWL